MQAEKAKSNVGVSPESTIESAPVRKYLFRKPDTTRNVGDKNVRVKSVCESTIESANRRDFIRKAALATAAVGVGGTILGSGRIIPESSAASSTVTTRIKQSSRHLAIWGEGYCGPGDHKCTGCCATTCITAFVPYGGASLSGDPASPLNCPASHSSSYDIGASVLSITNVSPVFRCSTCGPVNVSPVGLSVVTENRSHPSACRAIGIIGAACSGAGILGESSTGVGVIGKGLDAGVCASGHSYGVFARSCCTGVLGSGGSVGVCGQSTNGVAVKGTGSGGVCGSGGSYGVRGTATCGVIGNGTNNGVYGCSATGIGVYGNSVCGTAVSAFSCKGIALQAKVGAAGAIPIVAKGACGQTANLQQWETFCSTPLSVVNKCGWLGVGSGGTPTTLSVHGSMSAKTVIKSANYKMGNSDFAVLASGAIKVTLPKASTGTGMIVFIKKTDSGTTTTLEANGTDTIEGKTSIALKKQYDSLPLISNGSNEWFILSASVCKAFIS